MCSFFSRGCSLGEREGRKMCRERRETRVSKKFREINTTPMWVLQCVVQNQQEILGRRQELGAGMRGGGVFGS